MGVLYDISILVMIILSISTQLLSISCYGISSLKSKKEKNNIQLNKKNNQ